MDVPDDLRYTSDHEWARVEDDQVRVGLTDFAQDALGDVVFVAAAPVGVAVNRGGELGEVESTKSVSQVYAPVSGTVVEVNSRARRRSRSASTATPTARAGCASSNRPSSRRARRAARRRRLPVADRVLSRRRLAPLSGPDGRYQGRGIS